jgi:molybdate transport system ATP-binding protein
MIRFNCRISRPAFTFEAAFEAGQGVTALFGPSGSGKTTAIRLLAGLETPERGRITVDGDTLLDTEAGIVVPAHKRRIGVVFQDALLLPHLSVRANLTYGRWFTPKSDRRIAFDSVVDVLGIGHLLDRRPGTLSGGERQRAAIGRAILASPRLLLLDEPLASLDAARKMEVLPFIERLRDEFAIPIIYVSHSVEEVARLASKVVRLADGKVMSSGDPGEVLIPASLAASSDRFDAVSILNARVSRHLPEYGLTLLAHPAGEIAVPGRIDPDRGAVNIAIRATNVTLAIGRPGNISVRTVLAGRITALETNEGPFALATVALTGGDNLQVYLTRLAADRLGIGIGDGVTALVKSATIDERNIAGFTTADRMSGPAAPPPD